jgi:hypothetical protein
MKAIQATYYSREAIETVIKKLASAGYSWELNDTTNMFVGQTVTVIVPSGKGKNKKIEQINEILGRGINIYLSSKKFYSRFPNYAG